MNSIDPMAFGKRLKEVLKGNNLTQKDVAQELGVSKTAINNYVQGRIPDAIILYKLASKCNVSVEWLLTGLTNRDVNSTKVESVKDSGNLVLLSKDEEYLIKLFRKFSPRDQIKIEGMIEDKLAALEVSTNKVQSSSASAMHVENEDTDYGMIG